MDFIIDPFSNSICRNVYILSKQCRKPTLIHLTYLDIATWRILLHLWKLLILYTVCNLDMAQDSPKSPSHIVPVLSYIASFVLMDAMGV